jgi:hypothetical protein
VVFVRRPLLHDFVAQQAFKTTMTKDTVATDRRGTETVTADVTVATSGPAPTDRLRPTPSSSPWTTSATATRCT